MPCAGCTILETVKLKGLRWWILHSSSEYLSTVNFLLRGEPHGLDEIKPRSYIYTYFGVLLNKVRFTPQQGVNKYFCCFLTVMFSQFLRKKRINTSVLI